jgi:hypothetical protein
MDQQDERSPLSTDEQEALIFMMLNSIVTYTTCAKCGGPARGSFYSSLRDTNPFPHSHIIPIGCLACGALWHNVIIHPGHDNNVAA